MKPAKKDNPFVPGTGHAPPLLAGRDEETRLLALMLKRLNGPRAEKKARLAQPPFSPIKIVGPCGVGKTVLLTWAEEEAEALEIPVISCAYLEDDAGDDPFQSMVDAMKNWPAKILDTLKEAGVSLPDGFGVNFKTDRPADTYEQLVESILQARPLLLLLDEVHHFDLRPLGRLLQVNQQLISQGLPLGVVLAGTPGLDSHLAKARATFIFRCKHFYIHTLNDDATRQALREPFQQAGVKVAPDALEAMAAQTDNYPFFIQLMGRAVWYEMAAAGREDVDVEMVRRAEEQARKGRDLFYNNAWLRMYACGLMPHARRAMEMLDRNGGRAPEKAVLDLLCKASGGNCGQAMQLYEALREDGLIWTEDGETKPGLSSFSNYCKARDRDGSPPSGGGFRPRSWLHYFLPSFFPPKKRG